MKLYSLVLLLQDAATETSFTNELVQRFNEGGGFMWPVLICLVIGLAIGIERIITLNLADTNTRKFLARVKTALDEGGVSRALEVCENTRGPVASVSTPASSAPTRASTPSRRPSSPTARSR